MNKLVIGCLGILGLGIVGTAGASYFAYRKVASAVAPLYDLGSVAELERSVRNDGPYVPPPSGEPSPAQVARLLEVQQAVRTRLGARADELYHRYRKYFEPVDGVKAHVGSEVDSALLGLRMSLDLAGIYVEGKRAQVEAINRSGLSMEEYRWTRSRVYAALGVSLPEMDIAGVVAAVKDGRPPAAPTAPATQPAPGSFEVRKLIEPHRKGLEDNVGLAYFDL